jgi:hypothetical protein
VSNTGLIITTTPSTIAKFRMQVHICPQVRHNALIILSLRLSSLPLLILRPLSEDLRHGDPNTIRILRSQLRPLLHAPSPIASHLLVACATQHPAVRLVDLRTGASAHRRAPGRGVVRSMESAGRAYPRQWRR